MMAGGAGAVGYRRHRHGVTRLSDPRPALARARAGRGAARTRGHLPPPGSPYLNHVLGLGVNGLVTVAMVVSLALLIKALPTRQETPEALLGSAAALWVTNILVFASWYWRLDAGGPHQRDKRPGHVDGAFLFPQMTLEAAARETSGASAWSPGFVDYLFLAFNTSTALSPTDVPVLSRWAKLLMMLQATISLTIVVLLAARAVNIL